MAIHGFCHSDKQIRRRYLSQNQAQPGDTVFSVELPFTEDYRSSDTRETDSHPVS